MACNLIPLCLQCSCLDNYDYCIQFPVVDSVLLIFLKGSKLSCRNHCLNEDLFTAATVYIRGTQPAKSTKSCRKAFLRTLWCLKSV